jgi:hypothetical protein
MRYKIEWFNIGRSKANGQKVVDVKSFQSAERMALKEIEKYLLSSDVSLAPNENQYSYSVYAGFHTVGEVRITKV